MKKISLGLSALVVLFSTADAMRRSVPDNNSGLGLFNPWPESVLRDVQRHNEAQERARQEEQRMLAKEEEKRQEEQEEMIRQLQKAQKDKQRDAEHQEWLRQHEAEHQERMRQHEVESANKRKTMNDLIESIKKKKALGIL